MKHRVKKYLIRKGLVTETAWQAAADESAESGEHIFDVLRSQGTVDEETILAALHRVTGIPFRRNLAQVEVPDSFTARVPAEFARNYELIGIGQSNGSFHVATSDPFAIHPMDELAALLEAEVTPVLAPKGEIVLLINRAYQQSADGVEEVLDGLTDDMLMTAEAEEALEDITDTADKAPIIRLVSTIFFEAIRMRASDIHFQPFEDRLQVRYRIDGILYDMKAIPKEVQEAVTSRIKVMGKMDIAERRLPQDGRTTVKVGDGEVDLRISSVPTQYGERIVLRLLDKTAKVYNLEEIGLTRDNYDLINSLIHYNHGIILVTGPTGSGKTTTLYAGLSKINSKQKNIMTIEDPIEYHLTGVSQIQVNAKKGLTFAAGLRSLLRQDPDVMMVGEIRDEETARIAIQSALTGHLVFSTLHTNDAPSAVSRLLDIGIEPYLVASSVIAVIAQRLVRLICSECKAEYEPTVEELNDIAIDYEELPEGVLWLGMGCNRCLDTGYSSRTAIYEALPIGEEIHKMIMARTGASEIKRWAVSNGMKTLRMDGARKVIEGYTTIEEVLRVTQMDAF